MNAPIRSVDDLVAALRGAQIERGLSDDVLEGIAGLPRGAVSKYLGPKKIKGLGSISLPLLLGGVGKGLMLVDDEEAIAKVKGRWKPRIVKGGATLQLRARDAVLASALSIEQQRKERMRQLGSKGGKMGGSKGGKRRMKTMSRRARQRIAAHAARIRWARQKTAP